MRSHWTEIGCVTRRFAEVWLALLFTVLLLVIVPIDATGQVGGAQTVRGQVLWGPNQPAVGVPVNLFRQDLGPSGFSYTDQAGMYYLYNIPPGDYTLQIWAHPGQIWAHPGAPAMTYSIVVLGTHPQRPFTDISPIMIR
jgi:hypothetical protein